jgi:hypothetical protein
MPSENASTPIPMQLNQKGSRASPVSKNVSKQNMTSQPVMNNRQMICLKTNTAVAIWAGGTFGLALGPKPCCKEAKCHTHPYAGSEY